MGLKETHSGSSNRKELKTSSGLSVHAVASGIHQPAVWLELPLTIPTWITITQGNVQNTDVGVLAAGRGPRERNPKYFELGHGTIFP